MLNNIVKVQENRSWAKNIMSFFIQGAYFKLDVIISSLINRFEEAIALKCSDQRMKYHVTVFASNI